MTTGVVLLISYNVVRKLYETDTYQVSGSRQIERDLHDRPTTTASTPITYLETTTETTKETTTVKTTEFPEISEITEILANTESEHEFEPILPMPEFILDRKSTSDLPLCPIYYHEPKLIFTEKQPPGIYPTQERMNSPTIMPDWFGLSDNKTLRKIEETKSIEKFRIDKNRLFDHWMNLSITRNEVNEEFKSIVRNGGHYWVVLSECLIEGQNDGFRGWNGSFKAILRAFWVFLGHFGPGHHFKVKKWHF